MDTTELSKTNESVEKEDITDSNINVRYRRLKVEETLLTKCTGKTSEDYENDLIETENLCHSEYMCLYNKLRKSFIDIRDIFEEVKANTNSQDNIKSLDIETIKKDVLDLDNKIKTFKSFLHVEIKKLQSSEDELVSQLNSQTSELININKRIKIRHTKIKEIVPSPVRNLISAPLKCPEVQQFQEFMANSKNRYGGWILYNHNIFERCWQKYFCTQTNIEDYVYQETNVENSHFFQMFVQEVCHKIPGITPEDVIIHNKWYTKYVFLKERQQKALEKWKIKKELIKSDKNNKRQPFSEDIIHRSICRTLTKSDENQRTVVSDKLKKLQKKILKEINRELFDEEPTEYNKQQISEIEVPEGSQADNSPRDIVPCSSADIGEATAQKLKIAINENQKSTIRARLPFSYRATTEQWNNRCKNKDEVLETNMDIELIVKRRIPDWRLALQDS